MAAAPSGTAGEMANAIERYRAGVAMAQQDRFGEAASLFRAAIAARPDFPEAFCALGITLMAQGRDADAVAAFGTATALRPDYLDAHVQCGKALLQAGKPGEAIPCFERALALAPGNADLHANLATALLMDGREEEAAARFEQALQIDPRCVLAHYNRSGLKTFRPGDPEIGQMERLVGEPDTGQPDRLQLHFALGKAWMDVGDADRAFAHLDAGNRIKRGTVDFDIDAEIGRMEAIAAAFSPEVMTRLAGGGSDSELPVFVVGMPRSGSTLVEQILASHPEVAAAGEIAAAKEMLQRLRRPDGRIAPFPAVVAELSPAVIADLARLYLLIMTPLAHGRPRLVDKLLDNYMLLGLIHLCLPHARIIHCRRDPLDTCLSCYATLFGAGQPFTYDLAELGRYWRAYDRMMAHWRALLPTDRFIEVRYEDLVADLDGEARRLVAHCGLEWNDACLEFYRTRRPVASASTSQVRRPIYGSSVGRWKRYRNHIGPLLEALQVTG